MERVYLVGTVKAYSRTYMVLVDSDLFVKVRFVDGKLSLSGVVGPLANGNCRGGAGQINMRFAHRNPLDDDPRYSNLTQPAEITFSPGWDAVKWLDLLDVWEIWHLNDMRSGSPAQKPCSCGLPRKSLRKGVCQNGRRRVKPGWERAQVWFGAVKGRGAGGGDCLFGIVAGESEETVVGLALYQGG